MSRYTEDYPEGETSTAEYWDRRSKRIDAEVASEVAYNQSPAGQREARQRTISALIGIRTDSGLTADQSAELDRLQGEEKAERDAMQAAINAEWTPEVTADRRTRWNAYMQAEKAAGRGVSLSTVEAKFGYTFAALKAAIARHGQ